ncbi:MAG: dehypoxanthine futalosine cyclase [Nitrospinota bacterium]|nr:dehypoxanthine futalosine cyclase [Nitrospinota bacterium]
MKNRITSSKAEELYGSNDLLSLGRVADDVRKRLHPEGIVTYIIDRNINYTNICTSGCRFCAFYRKPGRADGYLLSYEEISQKIQETKELDGVQILMQGGLHPTWKIEDYEKLLMKIKGDFDIHLHAFSPPEVVHMSKLSNIGIEETLKRLIDAGLDSIPGGGAEILVDRVRGELSPGKCSADMWIEVMRTAHCLGLKTTATMMYGHIETRSERIRHMERIRELQDETGGFTAFIPWPFQPGNTDLEKNPEIAGRGDEGLEYLRTVAISRLFLDNIPNIQASWVTQGAKMAQMALYFGANDMGSTMIEENVVKAAGVGFRLNEKDIRRIITDAGFEARRRRQDYSLIVDEETAGKDGAAIPAR